ncbi:MAG: hypothetical protein ACTHQM_06745 [Thermoanaerobaculia bacterium]
MTKKQRIYVFAFAGLMLFAGIGAFAYIVYISVKSTLDQASKPAPIEDRKLVITAADLKSFGLEDVDPEHETFSSTRSVDGTHIVEYAYTAPASDGEHSRLYIQSTSQTYSNTLSAMQVFKMQQLAFKGGLAIAGETKQESAPELVTVGDGRYAIRMKSKKTGEVVGNVFMVRQSRSVLTVIIVGMRFNDSETVSELLGPALAEQRRRMTKR